MAGGQVGSLAEHVVALGVLLGVLDLDAYRSGLVGPFPVGWWWFSFDTGSRRQWLRSTPRLRLWMAVRISSVLGGVSKHVRVLSVRLAGRQVMVSSLIATTVS